MKDSILMLISRLFSYTSAVAGFFFLDVPTNHANQTNHIIDGTIRLVIILLFWDLMTSLFFLWLRKRSSQDASANGYGIAVILLTFCTLFILQACRVQMNEQQFMFLLVALGFRGMSSGSWENQRGLIGMVTSWTSHSLLALLSFSLFYPTSMPWQVYPLSIGVSAVLCSCESSRNGGSINSSHSRWIPPLFRILVVLGPLIIATGALTGFLERAYLIFLVGVFCGAHLSRQSTSEQPIPTTAHYKLLLLTSFFILGLIALRYQL